MCAVFDARSEAPRPSTGIRPGRQQPSRDACPGPRSPAGATREQLLDGLVARDTRRPCRSRAKRPSIPNPPTDRRTRVLDHFERAHGVELRAARGPSAPTCRTGPRGATPRRPAARAAVLVAVLGVLLASSPTRFALSGRFISIPFVVFVPRTRNRPVADATGCISVSRPSKRFASPRGAVRWALRPSRRVSVARRRAR